MVTATFDDIGCKTLFFLVVGLTLTLNASSSESSGIDLMSVKSSNDDLFDFPDDPLNIFMNDMVNDSDFHLMTQINEMIILQCDLF